MGNVSHLCLPHLWLSRPHTIQLYHLMTLRGNRCVQMNLQWTLTWQECGFFPPLFSCRSARCKVISSTTRHSKPMNKLFQSLRVVKQHAPDCTITHKNSLLCKLAWFLSGLHDFIFNYTVSPVAIQVFPPLSLFFFFSYFKSVTAWVLN